MTLKTITVRQLVAWCEEHGVPLDAPIVLYHPILKHGWAIDEARSGDREVHVKIVEPTIPPRSA